ncbi:apolipoprotein N-acyltransferase [Micromonospora aurantiaca (nom. illeg.)]
MTTPVVSPPAVVAVADQNGGVRGASTAWALTASATAGLALLVAFPPYGWWWAAPVGVALLALAVHGRPARAGAALGMVCGLVFFVPLLSFTGLQVGWWPWLLLATLQSLYLALLGAATAYASALVDRARWAWPLVTGLLWVAQEAARSRTPFGGFPWGRLAFSQADAPTVRLASLGGAPLVTFTVAVAGGLLAMAVWRLSVRTGAGLSRRAVHAGLLGGLAAAVMAFAALVPLPTAADRTVVVAVVQGNVPRMGLDFNAQRRAVLDNHVTATLQLADAVREHRQPRPELVIWPENSSDIDPLLNPDAAARIDAAAHAIGAPILVGAVLQGPGQGKVRNAGLVWTPTAGPTDTYVKRHPVPFAEYVPMRPLVRRVTTLVDRVRADFVAGTTPGVLPIGGVRVGDVICFEVAYDGLVRDTVTGGAQLLAVQTNNATFNYAEASQQLAMVRLRAVEHGRPALMASTVGISAFVDPDATTHDATTMNTQAVLVRQVRLATAITMATRVGSAPEWAMVAAAVAALLASARVRHTTITPAGGGGVTERGGRQITEPTREAV